MPRPRKSPFAFLAPAAATLLVACASAPPEASLPAPPPAPSAAARAAAAPSWATAGPADAPAAGAGSAPTVSSATTAAAYRRDAASHLYTVNAERIYKGVMQPNLYAIGVLDVEIDRRGQVTAVKWQRAPTHAPEVMEEIVRTVRAAAPYPVPSRLGRVTYSDVWLWDKSGRFQLDTLTEGQL